MNKLPVQHYKNSTKAEEEPNGRMTKVSENPPWPQELEAERPYPPITFFATPETME